MRAKKKEYGVMITISDILQKAIPARLKNTMIFLLLKSNEGMLSLTNEEIATELNLTKTKVRNQILRLKKYKMIGIQHIEKTRVLTINSVNVEIKRKLKK